MAPTSIWGQKSSNRRNDRISAEAVDKAKARVSKHKDRDSSHPRRKDNGKVAGNLLLKRQPRPRQPQVSLRSRNAGNVTRWHHQLAASLNKDNKPSNRASNKWSRLRQSVPRAVRVAA